MSLLVFQNPNVSCNGVFQRFCMDNRMWEKKKNDSFKLSANKKMNGGSVEVSYRNLVTPLMDSNTSSNGLGIVEFISGKVFLITGATGFLAKVLIEKILRTVPDVGKIYILMRAKDKESAMQRLRSEIMDTELFKNLQQTHGKSYQTLVLSKLIPVAGNMREPNLGFEACLADRVTNEVDVIINLASNTTLDERYDVSLDTNTQGLSRFLSFAKSCKRLMLFLHVSTAYVHGERQGIVMEKPFYIGESIARERASSQGDIRSFPLLSVEDELRSVLGTNQDTQDPVVSQKMKDLGLKRAKYYGWQNTYLFTKTMGEMMLTSDKDDIPVVIVRPSIIESTYMDPFPGWIEGIRMVDPVILSYAKGELTGFPADSKGVIDIVPADMVVNAILAAAVKHASISKPGLNIYHVASSVANPLGLQDFFSYFFDYFDSSPYVDMKRKPIKIEKMKLFDSMADFDSHMQKIEAGRRNTDPRSLQKWLNIAKHLAKIYEPYTFYAGRFDISNTESLLKEMSEEEKKSFGFDVRSIDWRDYWCNIHIPGLMTHVLKGRGQQ